MSASIHPFQDPIRSIANDLSAANRRHAQKVQEYLQQLIDYYFDGAMQVVKRSKELAWESKELVVALLILILLIKHSVYVLMN